MQVEKDLNNNDIIPEGTWDMSEFDILESLKSVEQKLDRIENMISNLVQVNNINKHNSTAGRKCLKMYYENKLIDNEYLIHLKDVLGLSIGQILKDFFYVDQYGDVIKDKKKCRNMINNRLRSYRLKE